MPNKSKNIFQKQKLFASSHSISIRYDKIKVQNFFLSDNIFGFWVTKLHKIMLKIPLWGGGGQKVSRIIWMAPYGNKLFN